MDPRTSYPQNDGPLLAWYDGAYTAAFVALHPFVRVPGLDPAACDHGTLIIDRREIGPDLLEEARRIREEQRGGRLGPKLVGPLIKAQGQAVSWSRVCADAGFAGPAALNRALLSTIGALSAEAADPEGAERLTAWCARERIFPPTEGEFQILMEDGLARMFADHETVELADQFEETGTRLPAAALRSDRPWRADPRFPVMPRRIYTDDRTTLAVVDWDSVFTLLCVSRERPAPCDPASLFEGFWCPSDMRHDWWRAEPPVL